MRSISTTDPLLSLAIQNRAAALALIEQRKAYRAIAILDGALSMADEAAPGPERDEVMIVLKTDLARAVFGNGGSSCPNAFREAGPDRMFTIALGQCMERFGVEHAAYAYVLAAEADMYRERCEYLNAERMYLEAFRILDTRDCPDPELLASVLEGGAAVMDKTNRESEARRNRARAGEVRSGLYRR